MKLLSYREILTGALHTVRRFPLVVCTSFVGVLSAIVLIDYEGPPGTSILFNIAYASIPGIFLFLAIALSAEKRKWNMPFSLGVYALGILLLTGYAATLPSYTIETPALDFVRLMYLTLAMYFLTAYAPYAGKGTVNGFWQYNKALCFRILMALLYSSVMYTGLTLALLAINNLFGIDIEPKRYGELAVIVYGFINTLIFLRGIPDDLEGLDSSTEYPKGLKIFVQYILLPLSAVYLVIIYAYAAKIIFSWSWPEGWISRMILGYSATGMLSLLFLHPIHTKAENGWMRTVFRSYFISMIPLVILLPMALFRRISQYGFTENRYTGMAVAVFLILTIVYFALSKRKNIKVLPISLFIVCIGISIGPWNMFAVSEQSQKRRLELILSNAGILTEGKVVAAKSPVSSEEKKNISSIVGYLYDMHGYEKIQPWFSDTLYQTETYGKRTYFQPEKVVKMFGVEYVNVWQGGNANTMMLTTDQNVPLNIEGYQVLIRSQFINGNKSKQHFSEIPISYSVSHNLDTVTFISAKEHRTDTVHFDIRVFAAQLQQEFGNSHLGNLPQDKLTMTANGSTMKLKLFFRSLEARAVDNTIRITFFSIDIAYAALNSKEKL